MNEYEPSIPKEVVPVEEQRRKPVPKLERGTAQVPRTPAVKPSVAPAQAFVIYSEHSVRGEGTLVRYQVWAAAGRKLVRVKGVLDGRTHDETTYGIRPTEHKYEMLAPRGKHKLEVTAWQDNGEERRHMDIWED